MTDATPQRPIISIDRMDVGPSDLPNQLPKQAELLTFRQGQDGVHYGIAVAKETPIAFRASAEVVNSGNLPLQNADPQMYRRNEDGSVDLIAFGLVMAPRVQGTNLSPQMKDFPVALAYVVDNSFMKDETVDFSKLYYAAVVTISSVDSAAD